MLYPLPRMLKAETFCISVYERVAPVGVYSLIRPVTLTMSPTLPVAFDVKINSPSDVVGSPSPFRSWMKKPLPTLAVMTPLVVCTVAAYGLLAPEPWICGMVTAPATLTGMTQLCDWPSLLLKLTVTL